MLRKGKILKEQACFLPNINSYDGQPIIDKIPHYDGAYIATGHGCWGILTGPATGKCLAQLILNHPLDVDLTRLSMERMNR